MAEAMVNDFTDVSPDGQETFMPKGMKSSCTNPDHLLDRRSQQVIRKVRTRLKSECRAIAQQSCFLTEAELRLPTRQIATSREIAISTNRQRTRRRRECVTSIKMLGPQTVLP